MALALALVSFSCTGPIVGTLLVESASIGGIAPFVGMFGFSLALALPFTLFAAFPGWMNSLPKSGGWLNTVKVFLGFLELALAFKFLSTADLVSQSHLLERELFLAIWIGIFTVLAIYLFGGFKLPHDSPLERLSVGRALLGTTTLIFVAYLIPGMWGAPLKLISGFPPSPTYSEWKQSSSSNSTNQSTEHVEGMHEGVHGIMMFDDYDKALAYAKKVNKPLMLDFTGWGCQNCRKMEETVWNAEGVLTILKDKVVVASLYVDEKKELPTSEHKELEYAPGKKMSITQVGHKWGFLQMSRYKSNSQPHYRMLSPDGTDLSNGPADFEHHGNAEAFQKWLEEGLKLAK
jgi:thiol:disulfide interchange protein DsbD